MNINIHAITVCVFYSQYLKHCITNKRFFKRWVIVTVEDDVDTINLCKKHNLEYIFSKTLYTRTFGKGCAINEAFDYLGKDKEWYLHIDADILLPDYFPNIVQIDHVLKRPKIVGYKKNEFMNVQNYERNGPYVPYEELIDKESQSFNLYTMGRVNIEEQLNLENFNPQEYWPQTEKIQDQDKGWGYFQLFHLPTYLKIHPNLYQIYPSLSNNAGNDDIIFKKMFNKVITLDAFCMHLSPTATNWEGV